MGGCILITDVLMRFNIGGIVMSGGINSIMNCASCRLKMASVGDRVPAHGSSAEPLITLRHALVVACSAPGASFNRKVLIVLLDPMLW